MIDGGDPDLVVTADTQQLLERLRLWDQVLPVQVVVCTACVRKTDPRWAAWVGGVDGD